MKILSQIFEYDNLLTGTLVNALRSAYADEVLAVAAYTAASHNIVGQGRGKAKEEFADHSAQEQEHANLVAQRIRELGGNVPNTMAEIMQIATCVPKTGALGDYRANTMLMEAVEDEACAITKYTGIIAMAEQLKDYATVDLLSKILGEENEHKLDFDLACDDTQVS
jgi:bacterioferritin